MLPRVARECYRWLLCPGQETPTDPKPMVEVFTLKTSSGSLSAEIERVCLDNELVILTWSPIHLRTLLQELYWKNGRIAASAAVFFEDTLRYLYLPRFKRREVLLQAIRTGAASRDFFGTAAGQDGESFQGFQFGGGEVVLHDTLLLIEPEAARAYEEAHRPVPKTPEPLLDEPDRPARLGIAEPLAIAGPALTPLPGAVKPRSTSFHATAEVPTATAKMRLVQIAEEIIAVLCSDPNASVRLTVEIAAEFPEGVSDPLKRAISENARSLELKNTDWE